MTSYSLFTQQQSDCSKTCYIITPLLTLLLPNLPSSSGPCLLISRHTGLFPLHFTPQECSLPVVPTGTCKVHYPLSFRDLLPCLLTTLFQWQVLFKSISSSSHANDFLSLHSPCHHLILCLFTHLSYLSSISPLGCKLLVNRDYYVPVTQDSAWDIVGV